MRLFFLSLISVSVMASNIQCRIPGQEGSYLLLGNSSDILSSDQIALVGANDVEGTYSPVYGLHGFNGRPTLNDKPHTVSFKFQDGRTVDWTNIDPSKKCYVVLGTVININNLRRNNTDSQGDYLAQINFYPHVQINPKKKDCSIPRFQVPPQRDLTCVDVKLEVKTK